MKSKFQEWYGNLICDQLDRGLDEEVVMRLSVIKPLIVSWIIDLYNYMLSRPLMAFNMRESLTFCLNNSTHYKITDICTLFKIKFLELNIAFLSIIIIISP